ncbi:MAG: RNA polymerase sigma factor [Bacillota bacterium]
MSDTDLVLRAKKGDRDALGVLVERHAGAYYRSALAILGHEQDARDAVQDAVMILCRDLRRLNDPASFKTWSMRILVRRSYDIARKKRPEAVLAEAHLVTGALAPEDGMVVREALAQLDADHRVAVGLRYFEGLALAEIAAVLDIPVGTVKSRLHNGLKKLRGLLSVAGEGRV